MYNDKYPMTQSTRLWTSLCSCSDKFRAVPGGASELFIDKMFKFRGWVFCRILRHFSHSVRMDVSAHFSALDDEEFFVVEGSGWRGRRESDSQVFCHSN